MRRLDSLRARMTAVVTVGFALWMLLVCLAMIVYLRHSARSSAQRLLETTTTSIRDEYLWDLSQDPGADGAAAVAEYVSQHREDLAADHLSLALMDAQGNTRERYQRGTPPWPSPGGDRWQIQTVQLGPYLLVVGLDWEKPEQEFRRWAAMLVAVSLCVIVAATFGTWVLVGRTLSPIRLLAQQADATLPGALRVRLESPSQDVELVGLVATLNGLLGRVAEFAAARGRFYAAASHELRTPLQALSGHLEVALGRSRSAEEYRTALGEASTQTRRLMALVGDLLLLNQLDASGPPPMQEPVCLAELCDRALAQAQAIIDARGLQLTTDVEQDIEVMAPLHHAEMLLRNLVENAAKYAASDGEVRISLARSEGAAVVEIYNTCPPIHGWDPDALFEPFARLDDSRNQKTGGNGLGLAICKAIAVANGWTLTLMHDGRSVRATVSIPCAA